jgi:hypothetical protein
VLLDGEIMDYKVLDRPVGLFEVDRVLKQIRNGRKVDFLPEYFFYHGQRHPGAEFHRTIEELLIPSLAEVRSKSEIEYFVSQKPRYKLCPVTSAILSRYADFLRTQQLDKPVSGKSRASGIPKSFDTFISFGDGDEPLARQVSEYVRSTKKRQPFFYKDHAVSRWGRLQDDALDTANCLIVVGSQLDRLKKGWPEHEWWAFLNAMNIHRKPSNAKFIPFVQGIEPRTAPISWLPHQFVYADDIQRGLRELGDLLDRP